MDTIYHITTRNEWTEALKNGSYIPKGYASEGFIHFSFLDQVTATAGRYYAGVQDLIVLKVNTGKLNSEIRTEQAPNGGWYPHLYGTLNLDAVEKVLTLQADKEGNFRIEGY